MVELGELELRVLLEEATEEALELADELATFTASGLAGSDVSRVAANYLQARILVRRLRRALTAEVGA